MTDAPRLSEPSDVELRIMVAQGQAAREELIRRRSVVDTPEQWFARWGPVVLILTLLVAWQLVLREGFAPLLPGRTYKEATSNSLAPVNPAAFP